ncbi:hypothetical protein FO519_004515 [Halicephalobus sp. NKZ332]|nr:hypothetical protein FO519_004515 [Halicephalobus sp. NKZ332]
MKLIIVGLALFVVVAYTAPVPQGGNPSPPKQGENGQNPPPPPQGNGQTCPPPPPLNGGNGQSPPPPPPQHGGNGNNPPPRRGITFCHDFVPYEFVKNAQNAPVVHIFEDSSALEFTLPPGIQDSGAEGLTQDAQKLSLQADNLLNAITDLLNHFDNSNGYEAENLTNMVTELGQLQTNLSLTLSDVEELKSIVQGNEIRMENLNTSLNCLMESNCTSVIISTTMFTPPESNCSDPSFNRTGINLGDSGFWSFELMKFGGCDLILEATYPSGLWFNIQISNFDTESGGTLEVDDARGNSTKIENATTILNGLRGQTITIFLNGDLKFDLNFTTVDPCANLDCVNGHCIVDPSSNKASCNCSGCYLVDSNTGTCTKPKPDPCDQFGDYCSNDGTCAVNSTDCSYYCKCNNRPPGCTTATYCDPSDSSCPDSRIDIKGKRKWWLW